MLSHKYFHLIGYTREREEEEEEEEQNDLSEYMYTYVL